MTLVILAAGMGSRFGGLKQIEPVGPNEEFIIDYSIYDALKAGFNKIVFIIKEDNYDIFKETIGGRVEGKIEVEYVFQKNDNLPNGFVCPSDRVKPWGTAHAILCCKDVVKENFAIINADDFYGRDAFKKIGEFLKNNNESDLYAMIGYKVSNTLAENGTVKRGVCEYKESYLTKIIESVIDRVDNKLIASPLDGSDDFEVREDALVSMNMFGFTPKLFDYLENGFVRFLNNNVNNLEKCEYLIPTEIFERIENFDVKVKVLETSSKWLGITYKEDKDKVVSELKKLHDIGEYPSKFW